MEELGNNMNKFLEQVQQLNRQVVVGQLQKDTFLRQLKDLLGHYSDLKLECYKGHIEDIYYNELVDSLRDPEERKLWDKITTASVTTLPEVESALALALQYITMYPQGPTIREAEQKRGELMELRKRLIEDEDWKKLDMKDYHAMRNYLQKYPSSVHKNELDDMMWNCTNRTSKDELRRYLDDWKQQMGKHVTDAESIFVGYDEWESIRNSEDVFKVIEFVNKYSQHPVCSEANGQLQFLQGKILDDMRFNPSKYTRDDLDRYIKAGIFTEKQLVNIGLIGGGVGHDYQLPNLEQYTAYANYEAIPDCTDVYLIGVPGSGKTCLLMGLTGAEGNGYSINFKAKGGPYASALKLYLNSGMVPTTTPGQFVTTIKSTIEEKGKKGEILNHEINFVEMSGEEFANKIANNDDTVSLKDMGEGTMNLLRNDNRKVFLIIVDPTRDVFNFKYDDPVYDNGNIIGINKKTILIDQTACIAKFVDLFEMPENKEFMKRVDAIHFIVTKADTLGRTELERKENARDLLIEKYRGPIKKLFDFCRRSKRVNYATDFKPKAYPFSLGQFFVGGSFRYNQDGTLKAIDTLRHITAAKKEGNFWDDLRDKLA